MSCLDLVSACFDRWAAKEGDTPAEKLTKRVFFVLQAVGSVSSGGFVFASLARESHFGVVSGIFASGGLLMLLCYMRLVRRVSLTYVYVTSAWLAFFIAVLDWIGAAQSNVRIWPWTILLVDVLLVMGAPDLLTRALVSFTTFYMVVMQVEEMLRFGLFDMPGLAPYDQRACLGDCAHPPCPRSPMTSFVLVLGNGMVFLMDYYFTRGFALQVRREKDKITAAVAAAQSVAGHLAVYDLEAAEDSLRQSEAAMPEDLCASLRIILDHLRSYKPYIPQPVLLLSAMKHGAAAESTLGSDDETDECLSRSTCSTPASGLVVKAENGLVWRRMSLLHLGLSLPSQFDGSFLGRHSDALEAALKCSGENSGAVDSFHGDCVSISFNASGPCARHALGATRAGRQLCLPAEDLLTPRGVLAKMRGAVATGHALTGSLGGVTLKRHCIVGSLVPTCRSIERAAQVLGHSLLCTSVVSLEVAHAYQTRVLLDRCILGVPQDRDKPKDDSAFVEDGPVQDGSPMRPQCSTRCCGNRCRRPPPR
eukprot:Rhum_TRINITY_DN519_c0_g1::Rhum_TRINITY_DN519_c0_g1_i1::g.1689::m.1689